MQAMLICVWLCVAMGGYSLLLRRFVFRMAERRARNEWLVMNRNRPWEGYCLLPAFLCAHVLKRDVWVRGRGGYVWKSESVPHVNRSAVPLITALSLRSPSISMQIMKLTKVRYMASSNEYSKKRLVEISTAAYNTSLENTNYRNRYCN